MTTPFLPRISDSEFANRLKKTAEQVKAMGLAALIVHSNEADFANVRYLSDYWPLFESAGVLIFPNGSEALLIGPESGAFACNRTKIPAVRKLVENFGYAEPNYPWLAVDIF